MLKVKQSYHGTGGKEGYRFHLYKNNRKIGELINLPVNIHIDDIVEIDGKYYKLVHYYDCPKERSRKSEIVWYEFEPYEFFPKYVLERMK